MEAFFPGDGEIRALLRERDWSQTPLGPIATWPKSLVGYVNLILDMPTPAIVFWGPEQTQLYNEGYATIMGPRHPRYLGAPYRECWPDTYPAIMPMMREVLAGGVAQVADALFTVTRHGFTEEAYFTFTFSPVRDDDGAIAGIFQPVVEVTERVITERRSELLRALARRPATANVAAAEAIATLAGGAKDIPFAAIALWDEAASRLVPAGETDTLCGRGCVALEAELAAVFEAGTARRVDDVTSILGFEPVGPWGDPTRSAYLIPLGARGVVAFGISPRIAFDASYQRFLEAAATAFADARDRALLIERERDARREAELQKERLATLFRQAPVPICVLRGPEHVIELANEHACAAWNRRPADVVGRPLFAAVPELRGQGFPAIADTVYRTGTTYVGKEVVAELRESRIYFNFVFEPLRDIDGRTEGVLIVAFDVTDEVRARQSKDELLAMLGHELRNPLAPLQTCIETLRRRLPGAGVDRQLDVIERQTHNLHRLVDDLLEVSRVTHGKIELRKERVALADVVERAIEAARTYLEGHETTFTRPAVPVFVDADPVRVEQIVVNLLTNAGKYTNAGGHVSVAVAAVDGAAEIRVADDGAGISRELLPHLFELFQQGPRDVARVQGGLGLGLTIVRRLAELHGGTVEARSDGAGRGSEFVVRLPLATGEALVPRAEPARSAPAPVTGRRVLVVDDNVDAADALAEALEEMGHEPRTANDGLSAVALCDEWKPDVVFLDIGLPGMDGYEAARTIRRGDHRPVLVALTGYGRESDRRAAREAGFDEHLVKPANFGALEAILANAGSRAL